MTLRRLNRNLWVARQADYVVGTIERGRRFIVSDGEGMVRGRFRTLTAAQMALTKERTPLSVTTDRTRRPVGPAIIAASATGVIAGALAVFGTMLFR